MGKSKGSKSKASIAPPKCTCDHPYKCSCGNRPERPSPGHKWDPVLQKWGGKGHKQKGASGTAATVAVAATTTEVGKTTLRQWEKLPSHLLEEVCRKDGRPRPKYKSIGRHRFRVIIQDAKKSRQGTDHDLILVPAETVENEEQAKEEAALLGLLHLTPAIPHERKLPEPYRTTWLNAVKISKQDTKRGKKDVKGKSTESVSHHTTSKNGLSVSNNVFDGQTARSCVSGDSDGAKKGGRGAKASSSLSLGTSFASRAEQKRQREERQKQIKARIRLHENLRIANRDHQVFMSARTRKMIETMLRGEKILWEEEDPETHSNEDDECEENTELKTYVVQRLHAEGFSKSQARTAFGQLKTPDASEDENQWENIYDECLQWLCIHLNEDQLPEGFDPRGRTLDVLSAPTKEASKAVINAANADSSDLAMSFGLDILEANLVVAQTKSGEDAKDFLWRAYVNKQGGILYPSDYSHANKEENLEVLLDELEALQAIFPDDECNVEKGDGSTTILVHIEIDGLSYQLEVVVDDGIYPTGPPRRVLLSGKWKRPVGTEFHVTLVKFLSELPADTPMIYALINHVQELLQSLNTGKPKGISLAGNLSLSELKPGREGSRNKESSSQRRTGPSKSPRILRPRDRDPFWSVPPRKAPPAESFPNVVEAMKRVRKGLPAGKARDEFLFVMKQADQRNRVVLVTGDTGCGKSTQLPQFILEDAPDSVKIVVAQPRRLAATGVASRVANERGETQPGTGSVGYVVRGDRAMCKYTRLMFCTTGVLLRQLQSDKALECITHIVVDEVHERHLDTDVLLGVLKASLKTTPQLRVVLMSATLDADRFAAYWGSDTPRMHIPGRTFPVTDFMLEDVLTLTGYLPPKRGKKIKSKNGLHQPKKPSPWADSEKSDEDETEGSAVASTTRSANSDLTNRQGHSFSMEELVSRVDESNVDFDMLGQLVKRLILNKDPGADGSILVFLSGVPEINRAMETIQKITRGMPLRVLPLHGGLQSKDQSLVFRASPSGTTKVILSTNVAETSITIPDCTIVIDSCREKQSSYDPVNRMPLLLERFAAKSSLKQRRGRAGRVREGTCYKLISKVTYSKLPDHGTPEIHRCALDQTLLSLLFLGVERGSGNFLRTLLDPPAQKSLDSAIVSLQKLGAVSDRDDQGRIGLTPLGMHLAGIPAPPTIGKMLVMGSVLGCRSAALAMAAGMSVGRSPFLRVDNRPIKRNRNDDDRDDKAEDTRKQRILNERNNLFKIVGNSDHAMLAAIYDRWNSASAGGGARKRVCDDFGLAFTGMRDIMQLVNQLNSALSAAGYHASEEADRNAKSWRIIRACAVAALAPSQLVRVERPSTKYAETAEGALELDGKAKELKFFIRASSTDDKTNTENGQAGTARQNTLSSGKFRKYNDVDEERVFVHPSSLNFAVGNYSCNWLVYHELIRTSKPFLRDATECSAYALLLFGGHLQVRAADGLIVVEGWVRLAANARVGALIGGVREKFDHLLTKKIEQPSFDIASTMEMKLIRSLLVSDGLGQ